MKSLSKGFLVLLSLALGAACLPTPKAEVPDQPAQPAQSAARAVTETPTPTATPAPPPTETTTPTITPTVVLDEKPQEVTFQAEDGQQLRGWYYPAEVNPAPVVVLFHWARGDQAEWRAVAAWIQNRGLEVEVDPSRMWLHPQWFPERTAEQPVGVFTFTFRECQGGCRAWLSSEWLLDVRAAMNTAAGLHGVDPQQILTVGASIGADGAVDGCAWLNANQAGQCRGAFAMSPASYLTVPFSEAAASLLEADPPLPVYCAFSRRDDGAWETCSDVEQARLIDYQYADFHGLEMIQLEREPHILTVLDEFIEASLP